MDHILLPRSKGYKYLLVLVDSLSLFSILLPAKTASAEKSADLFYHNLFMMFEARTLLSDRGSAFKSKLVKTLCPHSPPNLRGISPKLLENIC